MKNVMWWKQLSMRFSLRVILPFHGANPELVVAQLLSCLFSATRLWCTCASPGIVPWHLRVPLAQSPVGIANLQTTRMISDLCLSRRNLPKSKSFSQFQKERLRLNTTLPSSTKLLLYLTQVHHGWRNFTCPWKRTLGTRVSSFPISVHYWL